MNELKLIINGFVMFVPTRPSLVSLSSNFDKVLIKQESANQNFG